MNSPKKSNGIRNNNLNVWERYLQYIEIPTHLQFDCVTTVQVVTVPTMYIYVPVGKRQRLHNYESSVCVFEAGLVRWFSMTSTVSLRYLRTGRYILLTDCVYHLKTILWLSVNIYFGQTKIDEIAGDVQELQPYTRDRYFPGTPQKVNGRRRRRYVRR